MLLKAKRSRSELTILERALKPLNVFTDEELRAVPTGDVFVFDVESYPNYFCAVFKHVATGKIAYFEDSPSSFIETEKLRWMLWRFCLVGFFSAGYDAPMVHFACNGYNAAELNAVSNRIIKEDLQPRDIEREYRINLPDLNHIDLKEVAPLDASLKAYGARLHTERLQDLPYEPYLELSQDQARLVLDYCANNDLESTVALYRELCPHIDLRTTLGREYGRDLRSLSDAQIAEAVIAKEISRLTGHFPRKPKIPEGTAFNYNVPDFVAFQTPQLKAMLETVRNVEFVTDGGGSPIMPEALGKLKLRIGKSVYQMGMGGLHSNEKSAGYQADDDTYIIDRDVASYYPRIILNQRLFPKHLGAIFLQVYEALVNKRLEAKRAGNKIVADALKIVINGLFGKLGNKYSKIYSPDLMIQVTITGQLCLLMLIEMIELAGIPVVSGNTDGIVIQCPKARYDELEAIVKEWERITNFETEETRYKAIYSRDVNNYIALKEDGKCKTKGVYSEVGSALNSPLSKNPEAYIISMAVQAMIANGTPVEETIMSHGDNVKQTYYPNPVTRFLSVRNVKGGAEKAGVFLGKVVRWYYAKGEAGAIHYVLTGNQVPKSLGASPLMDLPPSIPADLDYAYYIAEAKEALYDVGFMKRPHTPSFFD